MKAEELRVGNYVNRMVAPSMENGRIKTSIDLWRIECTDFCSLENFKPIPLTEQWLIDFGFEKKGMFHKGNLSIVQKGELGYSNGRTYFNSWTILEHQPESVHQLQNLYFALTGENLHL